MDAFGEKPRTAIQDFFQYSYDFSVFNPVVAGQDVRWLFIDLVYDAVLRRDQSFVTVARNVFRQEMMALRLELLGLAFTHIHKDDDHLLSQSMFTKDYLKKNSTIELWEIMGEYNKVIVLSGADIVKSECSHRMTTTMSGFLTFEMAKKFLEEHSSDSTDLECKVRVCNRCHCDVAWDRGVTVRWLVATLSTRLGFGDNPSVDVLIVLEGALMWFYQSDKEAMTSINFT